MLLVLSRLNWQYDYAKHQWFYSYTPSPIYYDPAQFWPANPLPLPPPTPQAKRVTPFLKLIRHSPKSLKS